MIVYFFIVFFYFKIEEMRICIVSKNTTLFDECFLFHTIYSFYELRI